MGKLKTKGSPPVRGVAILLSNVTEKIRSLLNPRIVKIITSVALVLTAVIVFLIVFTALSQKNAARNRQRLETDYERGLMGRSGGPGPSDLLLPEDFPRPERTIYLYREPRTFWTDEEIAEYWIDLDDIVLDEYSASNRELVRSKLDTVP